MFGNCFYIISIINNCFIHILIVQNSDIIVIQYLNRAYIYFFHFNKLAYEVPPILDTYHNYYFIIFQTINIISTYKYKLHSRIYTSMQVKTRFK